MNNVLVATSVWCNSLIRGKRYEMFSSRCYRCKWVFAMAVLDWWFGAGHCKECYEFERDHFDGIQD